MANASFEKAMKLAILSGLKVALGPAFLMSAQRRPEGRNWVAAAMGEMILDKVGVFPSRSSLPLLIPHTLAGAWVARESMRADGQDDPMATLVGGAVAAGVSTFAPKLRIAASTILGIPDPLLGLLEDYLALKLGIDAVGLSMDEVTQVARESVEDLRERVMPAIDDLRERVMPAIDDIRERVMPTSQSTGAGSM